MQVAPTYSGFDEHAGAISSAANWLAGVLTGTAGTVIAILAVAGIGLAMLQGRVSVRSGLRVAIGCFILFGAPAIGQELLGLARWSGGPAVIEVQPAPSPPPIAVPSPPPQSADPYAGASVPM